MTLPDYRCEHVLFAGDAAHLLPIFGVRGANTGFQDAQNLGWKLALVARGLAGQALLDSYSAERVQAAREIIAEAGRSTRFMTPPSDGFLALRDATLGLSLDEPMVGPLFHWRTSRAHDHLASALNASGTGGGLPLDDDDRWPVPASTRTTADSAAGAQTGEVAAGVAGHEGPHAGAHVAGGATDPAHGAAAAVAAPPAIMDGAVLPGVRRRPGPCARRVCPAAWRRCAAVCPRARRWPAPTSPWTTPPVRRWPVWVRTAQTPAG
jgi:hypothetical protein